MHALSRAIGRVPLGCWVVLLSLPALAPLFRGSFFESHDGRFHVFRLVALDRAVRAGVLYPRWFPEFAFGYGHPVLNFYGPLAYYWGLPFTLFGADAVLATKLVLATGLIASALSMLLFARLHLDRGPALVAAVIYVYLPYHLVDLYVRGALAELLAFVWFPLVLWAFHRLVQDPSQHRLYRLALASLLLAALVVTHSLSALIFAPFLALYVVVLLAKQRGLGAWGSVLLALVLALTVSAFYWLPVLAESQFVGLGHGASRGYQDHLVSLGDLFSWTPTYPYPAEPGATPSFPLGLVQAGLIAGALLAVVLLRQQRWTVLIFLAMALFSAFLLTRASLPVWRTFERGLAFLQYPWRFQALTALATAFLAGALVQGLTSAQGPARTAFGALLLLATAVWALWQLPVQPADPQLAVEAMWQIDRENGQIGATWTGEYLPIWVAEQRWAISHPVPKAAPGDAFLPAGQLELTGVGHTRYDFRADVAQPEGMTLLLHQFHYPGWRALHEVGDSWIRSHPEGALGLAAFRLPPGRGRITVRLDPTLSQLIGTLVSFLASLALGVVLIVQRASPRTQYPWGRWLLVACYLLLAGVLLASLVWPHGFTQATSPVNANLENTVELLAFTIDEAAYHPGDTLSVTLYWRALREPDQDYKTFVHLTDAALTRQPVQHDGDPGGGFTPTTRWLLGELVPDTHRLALPVDLPPGRYLLWAGMYEHETVRNLSIVSADVPVADNRILLGEFEVLSP